MILRRPCPSVLLLAFNRPDTTRRVLDSVRAVQPRRFFFAVDGPRDRPGESHAVEEVRSLRHEIDWDCEVHTLFSASNLGCKLAVSRAISWFFDHVEEGIVLEDDCVAHPSFFAYVAELLERYRNDERVMMISGDNFQRAQRADCSYYFSRYAHIWGWATWRRAWRHYDHRMRSWPQLRQRDWLLEILGERSAAAYWDRIFEQTYLEQNSSWAYRWTFAVWVHGGLTILPRVNLVSNIGFGEDATHTTSAKNPLAALPLEEITFPLKHPLAVVRDTRADEYTQRAFFSAGPYWRRIARACRNVFRLQPRQS